MSTKSDSTSFSIDRKGSSIPRVMTKLHFIEGVTIRNDFHGFATEYLSLRRKRKIWASMGDLEKKLKWILIKYR